jgi:hypothetical protein
MLNHQPHSIEWRANTPFSTKFDDPYFSLDDGVAETEHVFLAGNHLPERYCDGFHIAELGFGTGLNLLVSLAAWRRSGQSGVLHYTSFEAFPLSPEQMITAQEAFEPLQELASELAPLWGTSITLADLRFELILGDARDILPKWSGKAGCLVSGWVFSRQKSRALGSQPHGRRGRAYQDGRQLRDLYGRRLCSPRIAGGWVRDHPLPRLWSQETHDAWI